MPDDIKTRLSKVPPFEEDVPMIAEVKEISKNQSSAPQIQESVVEEAEKEIQEAVDKAEETPEVKEETEEEPKEVSQRTAEQFDKLKEHNKELKEENKQVYKNVLDSLKPEEPQRIQEFTPQVRQQVEQVTTNLPSDKVDDVYASLIDKDGYIDPDLLIKTLKQANEEARAARLEAQQARKEAFDAHQETKKTKRDFEESGEVREVHKKYPQINPKNPEFNETFWDDVRKEIATAPILKGETPSFMEAADKIWNERYSEKEVEVKKKEKEQLAEKEDAKKQINASTPAGRSVNYYEKSDEEALRQAVIHGKKGALAERLRRIGQ